MAVRRGGGEKSAGGAGDEVAGHVSKPLVAVAGVIAQQGEGHVHVHAETFGQLALGLLDDKPGC
jgi:hypothetical protein